MFGGVPPAREIVDSQLAKGVILQWKDEPRVVLVALDWCEVRNEGYDQWRKAIAAAVGTSHERVIMSCVHQHAAMYADPEAEKRLKASGCPTSSMDIEFFDAKCAAVADAARKAADGKWTEIDGIGHGQAEVRQVASNRRIKGPDGQLLPMRTSACTDPELRAQPEGLIDPFLKAISFWSGDQFAAALYYYATHPMSYYRDGGVSKDFCGLARESMGDVGGFHLYFTGCAGNIAAGKYNDGSPEMRTVLKDRVESAMWNALYRSGIDPDSEITIDLPSGPKQFHAHARHEPVKTCQFESIPVQLPTREEFTDEWYSKLLNDSSATHNIRYRGAAGLTWRNRVKQASAIDFTCLAINDIRILQLPGEPFIEYQLYAQQQRPDLFVAVAGYGDCGPGYIPVESAYAEGGYEAGPPSLVAPAAGRVMRESIDKLLQLAG